MGFLMILSRYFVFIHFPKTGGTFVESLLKAHAPSDWDILDTKAIGIQGRSDPNHPTILDIPAEYQKLPNIWIRPKPLGLVCFMVRRSKKRW